MEVKRQFDVLNQQLAKHRYIAGETYTIADMAIWPWYGAVVNNEAYNAAEFLQVNDYEHVVRWVKEIGERPAVKRGRMVNRAWGDEQEQVRERHSKADFNNKNC